MCGCYEQCQRHCYLSCDDIIYVCIRYAFQPHNPYVTAASRTGCTIPDPHKSRNILYVHTLLVLYCYEPLLCLAKQTTLPFADTILDRHSAWQAFSLVQTASIIF